MGFPPHFGSFWQNKGYFHWIYGEPAQGLLKKGIPRRARQSAWSVSS
jgi:hypothetical protein